MNSRFSSLYHPLPESYFSMPTVSLAKSLLGKVLVHQTPEGTRSGVIVETEAYIALEDEACHAYRGITPRNAVMFGAPGLAYVYFTYGNHFMLNVVSEPEGIAAAVLIRAVEPMMGFEAMKSFRNNIEKEIDLTNGPGKLTAAFSIGKKENGLELFQSPLFIAENPHAKRKFEISVSTRIGITRSVELPWRFFIKGNPFVSKATPSGSDGKLKFKK
ncbi:MAG: DNA-3-methyladenine glycosylase [Chloroherpetonaceae bacterium]|nr:DNA-3-methyladenine glycosylase [Chloroherpetonaceae bacterium]